MASSAPCLLPLYTYEPLDTPNTIRLINLLPSNASDIDQTLRCSFSVVSLAHSPEFVALSYTWGENAFTATLECGESVLHITKNLHSALLQFRLSDRPLAIWADAVCINQADNAEKSLQIPLMADIYGQATEVLIWLGESTEGTKDVMLYLKRIGQKFLDRGGEILEPRDERSPENDALWKDMIDDPNLEKTDLIWTRPWFSRVWIIQELALASRAMVHCGDVSMDWEVLFASCKALGRAATDGGLFWDNASNRPRSLKATTTLNVWKLNDMRKSLNKQKSISDEEVLECLNSSRSFQCRDSVDRIFGLSSIFNRGKDVPFRIDYGKSEAEVFKEFARWALRNGDIVDILSFAGIANHSLIANSLGLPSWVPDWRLQYRSPMDSLGGFSAGHKLSSMVEVNVTSDELLVKGMVVDRIIAVVLESDSWVKPGQDPRSSFLRPAHLPEWYIQVELVINKVMETKWGSDEEYTGGGKLWDGLARTLIIDRNDPLFDYHRDRPSAAYPDDPVTPPHGYFPAFRAHMLNSLAPPEPESPASQPPPTIMPYESLEYHTRVASITSDRRFFITSLGYIGLGPKGLTLNDVVCVPAGASVPYILRPLNPNFKLYWQGVERAREAYIQLPKGEKMLPYILRKEEETYALVGECYTHGFMTGEVWDARGFFFEDLKILTTLSEELPLETRLKEDIWAMNYLVDADSMKELVNDLTNATPALKKNKMAMTVFDYLEQSRAKLIQICHEIWRGDPIGRASASSTPPSLSSESPSSESSISNWVSTNFKKEVCFAELGMVAQQGIQRLFVDDNTGIKQN
ncbi:heterokaryon incompatibility protein-domain-containing protein [Leptodontidium sp. MPI-SDFR-AT-0119]|nr:heterokaryon incompatibility protein-domain-containing protein [Leptodontidium sp. MPI-SDFR-AT-0119]